MKQYKRVMAGAQSRHAALCFKEGFIGVDYGIDMDLTERLPERWQDFNAEFRSIWLERHPDKSNDTLMRNTDA